jgi:hypothetical protein
LLSGGTKKITDPMHARWLLCLASEQRGEEAESDNDREPDQPHGRLSGGWLAGVWRNVQMRTSAVERIPNVGLTFNGP